MRQIDLASVESIPGAPRVGAPTRTQPCKARRRILRPLSWGAASGSAASPSGPHFSSSDTAGRRASSPPAPSFVAKRGSWTSIPRCRARPRLSQESCCSSKFRRSHPELLENAFPRLIASSPSHDRGICRDICQKKAIIGPDGRRRGRAWLNCSGESRCRFSRPDGPLKPGAITSGRGLHFALENPFSVFPKNASQC